MSEKGASTAWQGLPWREGPGGAAPRLPPQIQGVNQPVAAESSMSASEVTKTHKKTRAFREDGGRDCLLPPCPPGWRAQSRPPQDQSLAAWGPRFPHKAVHWFPEHVGGGGLWSSLESPQGAAPARPRLAPREVTRPWGCRLPALWSGHRPKHPRRRKRSGARLPGRTGPGAMASLTGAARFLRRPPGWHEPVRPSMRPWEGAPGASSLPFPDTGVRVAGGSQMQE